MKCINTESVHYQALLEMTGMLPFELNAIIRDYYETHDDFPTVDRCLTVDFDTSLHLIKTYGLKKAGDHYTIESGEIPNQIDLNTKYRDLEVEIKEPYVGNKPIIKIKKRALLNRDLDSDLDLLLYPNVTNKVNEIVPVSKNENGFIYEYDGKFYVTDLRISDYSALKQIPSYDNFELANKAKIPKNNKGHDSSITYTIQNNLLRLQSGHDVEITTTSNLPSSLYFFTSFNYPKFKVSDLVGNKNFEIRGDLIYVNPKVLNEVGMLERVLLKAQGYLNVDELMETMPEPLHFTTVNKGNDQYVIRLTTHQTDIQQITNQIVKSNSTIEPMLDRLEDLYGIKFNRITNLEIRQSNLNRHIPDATLVKAFILDGEIYINLDNATADSPIHEMGHLLLGTLRLTNPEIYKQLVDSVTQYPGYEYELKKYPFRSRMDVNEEIFVDLFARHYVLNLNLDVEDLILSDAEYEIARNIDSAIFPNESTTKVSLHELMGKSLSQIMDIFGTAINKDNLAKAFTADIGSMSRLIANIKEQLFKSNTLKEYCNG